ncbi:unnamed protein product [Linum trigynum]|uniref:Uncharacterized protein n=1 Tax=Linum trigynum TaxID=586398 RepID=A0AAV2FBY9_9ROSI
MRGALSSLFRVCKLVGRFIGSIFTGFLAASIANQGWDSTSKITRTNGNDRSPIDDSDNQGRVGALGLLVLHGNRQSRAKSIINSGASLMRKRKRKWENGEPALVLPSPPVRVRM